MRIVYQRVHLNQVPTATTVLWGPILGGLTGFLTITILSIVPAVLTTGDSEIRPLSVLGVAALAGLFSDVTIDWSRKQLEKILQ